jgi:nitrilase
MQNKHRKLIPSNPERTVWGWGDASGLKTVDTPLARVGILICWENYMPLVRYALYARGVDIYIAPTYDAGDRWLATVQHIAREGGCWVAGSGCAFRSKDYRIGFRARPSCIRSQTSGLMPAIRSWWPLEERS